MENIYAAMLLHKAGKEINEASVTKVLEAAGITVDAIQVKALVASLSEVNIDEAIKAAPAMMAAAPVAASRQKQNQQQPHQKTRRRKLKKKKPRKMQH